MPLLSLVLPSNISIPSIKPQMPAIIGPSPKNIQPTVVKRKTIDTSKPMDINEAILQMEFVSHDFFIFKDKYNTKTKNRKVHCRFPFLDKGDKTSPQN